MPDKEEATVRGLLATVDEPLSTVRGRSRSRNVCNVMQLFVQ
jgi:hypothetical protein